MTSPRGWWRRAAAALKDRRSICLSIMLASRSDLRNSDLEVAVIRATSHNELSLDYKYASRVFSWARTSPSFMTPLMWAVARRAERTRCWAVALKSLLLAHGLLLISSSSKYSYNAGRLPFNLTDFKDHSSSKNSWGYSAFVRTYFQFLDSRAILLSIKNNGEDDDDCGIEQVEKLQSLLDLLMQIKPYGDGLDMGLILEAMDCAIIEIFEVYSGICNGIASLLVGVLGSSSKTQQGNHEERIRKGMKAISVVKRASEQSIQLTNYFKLSRSLGVLNAAEFPPANRIPDEDITDLERMVIAHNDNEEEEVKPTVMADNDNEEEVVKPTKVHQPIIMHDLIQLEDEETRPLPLDWVVFEDDGIKMEAQNEQYNGNPFVSSPEEERQWAAMVHGSIAWNGNLLELI